jgi:hypothetical protein
MRSPWVSLFECCGGGAAGGFHSKQEEVLLDSSATESAPFQKRLQLITRKDSFDITFGERKPTPVTPRQRELYEQINLPHLSEVPTVPGCPVDATEEEKRQRLLECFRDFVLDLHSGMYLTHLTSSREYQEIHCQVLDDLITLNLNQSNGRIIEFPLLGVTKVYRIVRKDEHWYQMVSSVPMPQDHLIVVEFSRRKLAFVFKDLPTSQRFLVCIELLIRVAQQKTLHGMPTAPQGPANPCTTPRQVRNLFPNHEKDGTPDKSKDAGAAT